MTIPYSKFQEPEEAKQQARSNRRHHPASYLDDTSNAPGAVHVSPYGATNQQFYNAKSLLPVATLGNQDRSFFNRNEDLLMYQKMVACPDLDNYLFPAGIFLYDQVLGMVGAEPLSDEPLTLSEPDIQK